MAEPKLGSNERRPNPTDVHVGQRVRARRRQLGLSQERLAEALGLTFQQVQKYERGANRISASKLWDTAGFLNVTISYFFDGLPAASSAEGVSEPEASPFVQDMLLDRDGVELATAFTRIARRRMKRRIVDLVREIADEEATSGRSDADNDDAA